MVPSMIPSHSYGTSLAICDHTVLPSTRHKSVPAINYDSDRQGLMKPTYTLTSKVSVLSRTFAATRTV